jgi:CTP:molybdopterin cytidylyltransferase MocA
MDSELERLKFPKADRVRNPAPERGMFSSIQCVARWTGWHEELTHWSIVLGDQPHLRPETLQGVLALAQARPGRVCQPAHRGQPKHPVVLPKVVFTEMADSSAGNLKEFLARHPSATCEMNDPGLELDIDRPEDYRRALALARLLGC